MQKSKITVEGGYERRKDDVMIMASINKTY